MSKIIARAITLALPTDAPPTEFKIFSAGLNETQKGEFLFDAAAAKSVMANYHRAGVQLMLDLEHDSLNDAARTARSDAGDALGWFGLAVKPDGSLWAVNVRWNAEGQRRLKAKTQIYTSPAFSIEKTDSGAERVTSIFNVALCAMPATYGVAPLVAASRSSAGNPVTFRAPSDVRARLKSLAARGNTTVTEVLLASIRALDAVVSKTGDEDAMNKLLALVDALGLPEDASQSDIMAAVQKLLADLADSGAPSNADPSAAAADAPPPAQLSANVQRYLERARYTSAVERQIAAKYGVSVAEARQLKASSVRRTGSPSVEPPARLQGLPLEAIKASGMTVDEFLEKRRNAVRRCRG